MKKIFLPILLGILCFLFLLEAKSYAQGLGDTLLVYANPTGASIDAQITADQANNPPADRVYLLQQAGTLDTVYFYNASVNATYNLTIVGKPNPVTGMLPVIAPGFTTAGSSPGFFIGVTSNGKTLILKNLYISNMNINGVTTTTGQGPVRSSGDSVTILVNHCVFDGIGKIHYIYPNASYNKIIITNSEFRGQQNPTIGGGFLYYGLGLKTDTIIVKNCTMFCTDGRIFGETGYSPYFEFDHNTVFFDACLTGWASLDAPWTNAVITNNIFYGANCIGADTSAYLKQTYDGSFRGNHVIAVDSLNATVLALGYTEAERHVTIENNAYFWPNDLVSLLNQTKDDTGGAIVAPEWMTNLAKNMFSDKTNWPNLYEQNNVNADPGFNSAEVSQVVDSLEPYIADYWANGTSTHNWGLYLYSSPIEIYTLQGHTVPNDWASKQGYPVPEDLRYSNVSFQFAGTDGKALGDLNWFPEQVNATPPPVPTLVSPNGATGVVRNPSLTWNKSAGATGYIVEIASDSTFTTAIIDTSVTDTTVRIGRLLNADTKYYWHVAAKDNVFEGGVFSTDGTFTTGSGIDAVRQLDNGLPKAYALSQNYPNPFNPATLINYDLPKSGFVTLKVYNILGQEIATLQAGFQKAGSYKIDFDGSELASGIYLYKLQANGFSKTMKMVLMK